MNRRAFLREVAALGVAGALGTSCTSIAESRPRRGLSLRVAHLTDIHLKDSHNAPEFTAAAITHAQNQTRQPDFIFFGGDMIMDAMCASREDTTMAWKRWQDLQKSTVRIPHRFCLGNHDLWGWSFEQRRGSFEQERYGKALALDMLGMDQRFYSFDQAGWHFIVLDSIRFDAVHRHGYFGGLDHEQFEWLADDLAATPTDRHVCVLSHIPILTAAAFYFAKTAEPANWSVAGALMHTDSRLLKDLFRRHPQVKVCLSGHLHMVDDIRYLGVRYLCNGAVSGNWWNGNYQEFGPAYALVDFYEDGSVENQIVHYEKS